MDERAFPGVVVQGDSLYILLQLLKQTRTFLDRQGPKENLDDDAFGVVADLDNEIQKLTGVLDHYEVVCTAEGYGLPY